MSEAKETGLKKRPAVAVPIKQRKVLNGKPDSDGKMS